MTTPSRLHGYPDHALSNHIILDIGDLVDKFQEQWNTLITVNHDEHRPTFHPHVNYVVRMVIDCLQQEEEAELELSTVAFHDIASIDRVDDIEVAFNGLLERYNRVNAELFNITVAFGKAVIARLKREGIYFHGYLPYHFSGWLGNTVVLRLDALHGGKDLIEGTKPENVYY